MIDPEEARPVEAVVEAPGRRPDIAEQILMEVLGLLGADRN